MKKCPFCGADIEESARFCLYCMQPLSEKEEVLVHKKKFPQWLLFIVGVLAFIGIFLILITLMSGKWTKLGDSLLSGAPQLDSAPPFDSTERERPAVDHQEEPLETQQISPVITIPMTDSTTQPSTEAAILPSTESVVQPTTAPATSQSTEPTIQTTTEPIILPPTTESATEPATEPSIPPTVEPHTHSFTVENAISQYQKSAADCTTPAVYYYSCSCGAKGTQTFTYGTKGEHTVVTDPARPASCATPGLSEGSHCSTCQQVFVWQQETRVLGHKFRVSDSLPACLICGEMGTFVVRSSVSFPYTQDDKYYITGCTYRVRPSIIEGKWEFYFYVSFTKLPYDVYLYLPEATLFLPNAGYGYSTSGADPIGVPDPYELALSCIVPKTESVYVLRFDI